MPIHDISLIADKVLLCFTPKEPEPCIGCMQHPANVKLQKMCALSGEGECVPCYCRPMWCIDCMGKWFASRQNQQEPERWLASTSPCPTCRAKFCMLDVCFITRWQAKTCIIFWNWLTCLLEINGSVASIALHCSILTYPYSVTISQRFNLLHNLCHEMQKLKK